MWLWWWLRGLRWLVGSLRWGSRVGLVILGETYGSLAMDEPWLDLGLLLSEGRLLPRGYRIKPRLVCG